jgi:hypothetical protein
MGWGRKFRGCFEGRRAPLGYALLAVLGLAAAWGLTEATRRTHAPVVETVTTGVAPAASASPRATPVVYAAQLPKRDAEVEALGDRVAEAAVYLKKRQRAQVLAALAKARRAAARALEARRQRGAGDDALASVPHELDEAERAVERGEYEGARRRLLALNRGLDHVGP